MYIAGVVVLLFILPIICAFAEHAMGAGGMLWWQLAGKWMAFWAVGVRLFSAGMLQVLRPQFTAESIFDLHTPAALPLVREIGFGNLAIGALGLASLFLPPWIPAAALAGGLYYGLSGLGHLPRPTRNRNENVALITDLIASAALLAFVFLSVR